MAFNSYRSLITEGVLSAMPATPEITDFRQLYFATDTGGIFMWSPKVQKWLPLTPNNVQTPIVASTVQTRAGATQITGSYANLSTVANASDSVGLPDIAYVGQQVMVTNSGAAAAHVFPSSAANGANTTIDGGGAGAAATLTNVKSALFTAISLTAWQSIGFATRSA